MSDQLRHQGRPVRYLKGEGAAVAECSCLRWTITCTGPKEKAERLARRNLDLHLQRHGALEMNP